MNRQLDIYDLGYPREDRTESETIEEVFSTLEVAADNETTPDRQNMSLLDQILERDNLNRAYSHVRDKGGAPGLDNMNVRTDLGPYLKEHGTEIIRQIQERKYKPSPVKRVKIPKDKPGEFRNLGIPTGVDRVLQQAIAQVLGPIYEEQFSDNSWGFRPKRGCLGAIKRVRAYANQGYRYVVSLDLEKYFDSVNQMKLIHILQRTIKDDDVISLIHKFLKSGVIVDGLFERTEEGMPQGGPLSPLLSNVMLNELDQELERRGLKFVRYADDTIIMVKSRKAAHRVKESICNFIENKLKLKVNRSKTVIDDITNVKYLGYGFYFNKEYNDIRFRLHPKTIDKFKKKLKDLTHDAKGMSFKSFIKKLNQVVNGWMNYFYLADCKGFLRKLESWLRRRVRALIWRRWKRVRTRYTKLRQYGLSHVEAIKTANIRKGPWRASNSPLVHKALNNERLAKWGVPSLIKLYLGIREQKIKEARLKRLERANQIAANGNRG